MAILIIHAPDRRVKSGENSFETILKSGVGRGYIIYKKYISKLPKGSKVVLLRTDKNQARAEGVLDNKPNPTVIAKNGQQRYDVYINGLRRVLPYSYSPAEKPNRCGVAVIGDC